MSTLTRLARAGDRVFDRLRHRSAFDLSEAAARDGDLASLRGQTYAVLVTFRRNGDPVPSPVWLGLDATGRVYVKSADDVGKVKRVRRDSRVVIAPGTIRGKPTGPALRGTARLLPPEEWPHAERALASAYGIGRRVSERLLAGTGQPAYLEISPRRASHATSDGTADG